MKILVMGGMHGNEPLGLDIVRLFREKPMKNIDTVLANQKAILNNRRFVGRDLNRSFPGDMKSTIYEEQRAAQLLSLVKKYDIVLDFHNTHCPNNDCSFLGANADDNMYDISSWLGLRRAILADYDCINKYAPNCLSIEISLGSQLMDSNHWYKKINMLAMLKSIPVAKDIEKFRFVHRITMQEKKSLKLESQDLKAFKPIDKKIAKAMRVGNPAYPIFIGDKYTPHNYGGLVERIKTSTTIKRAI